MSADYPLIHTITLYIDVALGAEVTTTMSWSTHWALRARPPDYQEILF